MLGLTKKRMKFESNFVVSQGITKANTTPSNERLRSQPGRGTISRAGFFLGGGGAYEAIMISELLSFRIILQSFTIFWIT